MTKLELQVFGDYITSQEEALQVLKADPDLKIQAEAAGNSFDELISKVTQVVIAMNSAYDILEAVFANNVAEVTVKGDRLLFG